MRPDPAVLVIRLACAVLAAGLILAPATASPQEQADEKKSDESKEKPAEPAAKETKADKPRVFTNDDLKKYAASSPAAPPKAAAPAPSPSAASEEDFPAPEPIDQGPEPAKGPPEDRIDDATVPELQERERELAARLQYLQAKVSWLRNPLLPRPTPPEGEELLDANISDGQEMRRTRSKMMETENRLIQVRQILQAYGEIGG